MRSTVVPNAAPIDAIVVRYKFDVDHGIRSAGVIAEYRRGPPSYRRVRRCVVLGDVACRFGFRALAGVAPSGTSWRRQSAGQSGYGDRGTTGGPRLSCVLVARSGGLGECLDFVSGTVRAACGGQVLGEALRSLVLAPGLVDGVA